MARRCSCGYVIEDRWANGCPLCGAAIGGGSTRTAPGGGGGGPAVGSRTPIYLGLGLVAVLAVGGMVMNRVAARRQPPAELTRPTETDSTGRVRVGMPMADVARVLDAEAGRRPSAAGSVTSKFPDGLTKSGTLTWAKDSRVLVVVFDGGKAAFLHEHRTDTPGPEEFHVEFADD